MIGCLPCWGGLGVVEFLELVGWVCVLMGVGGVCVVVSVCLVPVNGLSSGVWLGGVFVLCLPLLSGVGVYWVPWRVFARSLAILFVRVCDMCLSC